MLRIHSVVVFASILVSATISEIQAFGASVSIIDIGGSVVNPLFAGPPGSCPPSWVCTGSPAPGFASYAPTIAQYPAGSPFPTSAFSPTVFAGSGTIRQNTSLTWVAGDTYTLNLWAGLPNTEPNGTTPVEAWASAARLYLTAAGGAQVAAFDIPRPPRGSFAANLISFTLPTNSPFIGQPIGVLIFVSAPSLFSANFDITSEETQARMLAEVPGSPLAARIASTPGLVVTALVGTGVLPDAGGSSACINDRCIGLRYFGSAGSFTAPVLEPAGDFFTFTNQQVVATAVVDLTQQQVLQVEVF